MQRYTELVLTNARAEQPLDIAQVRSEFPTLNQHVDGQSIVNFDNGAGTQVPTHVINRVANYYGTLNSNQGGLLRWSKDSEAVIRQARTAAAAFLNAETPEQIVFGPNMTAMTFAFSRVIGRALAAGDEIVVTRLEHDANVSPWAALGERGVVIKMAEASLPDCTIDLDDLKAQITSRTRVVAMTQAQNVVGSIQDLSGIARLAHDVGAWLWVDSVHYAPHGLVDVQALDCDFLVCSAYKFYGPHLGMLYGKRELLETLEPYKLTHGRNYLPTRWESGALNYEGVAGLLGTFEYFAALSGSDVPNRAAFETAYRRIESHERALAARLLDGLSRIPGIQIHGIADPTRVNERTPTVSITWPPYSVEQLNEWLAKHQVFVRHGHYGGVEIVRKLGLGDTGTLRIGMAHYNAPAEVDILLELLTDFPANANGAGSA